uniref:Uncharacterized protein n=1 Tax=Candidatus Kentrum sp. SD TaxID=2126332 RepID=A0A450Z0E1_9GAMM|nr:MAG: hypothetical protein BECKSD772F_GA0070984_10929 [Candidatus Kentron sp. SD]VFK47253.1 MAG: hypothetical protein BECKSD772E_GA0070983_10909 [Candidatus Kentron sp. SD]VFK80249.1 MAG: hypothetical protein BECKSD772D_GA0070982_10969 [Candidatus Kentron sp. SD]
MTTILQSKDYSGKVVLYMAMELSNAKWKLGFSNGSRRRRFPGRPSRRCFFRCRRDRA